MSTPEIKIIPVKNFNDSFTANLMKSKIESAGIECFLTNDDLTTLAPYLNNATGMGINLMVNETDYESALKIINDHED